MHLLRLWWLKIAKTNNVKRYESNLSLQKSSSYDYQHSTESRDHWNVAQSQWFTNFSIYLKTRPWSLTLRRNRSLLPCIFKFCTGVRIAIAWFGRPSGTRWILYSVKYSHYSLFPWRPDKLFAEWSLWCTVAIYVHHRLLPHCVWADCRSLTTLLSCGICALLRATFLNLRWNIRFCSSVQELFSITPETTLLFRLNWWSVFVVTPPSRRQEAILPSTAEAKFS